MNKLRRYLFHALIRIFLQAIGLLRTHSIIVLHINSMLEPIFNTMKMVLIEKLQKRVSDYKKKCTITVKKIWMDKIFDLVPQKFLHNTLLDQACGGKNLNWLEASSQN